MPPFYANGITLTLAGKCITIREFLTNHVALIILNDQNNSPITLSNLCTHQGSVLPPFFFFYLTMRSISETLVKIPYLQYSSYADDITM